MPPSIQAGCAVYREAGHIVLQMPSPSVSAYTKPWPQGAWALDIRLGSVLPVPASLPLQECLDQIAEIEREAHEADWDGEGADPVAPETIEIARQIAPELLRFGPPDVSANAEGAIAFDWMFRDGAALTVGVTAKREIAFAGVFGESVVSGRGPWKGTLPGWVQCCLKHVKREYR